MIRSARRILLLLTVGLAFVPSAGRAQAGAPLTVKPTVTADSGDPGGASFGHAPDVAKTRRYYVAAESELWDYAPSGRDEICGNPLPPLVAREHKGGKLRYVQYTDGTFTTKVIPNRSLGILGPVLRGVVGEFLAVTFLNRTDQPLSMHPHGVKYDKDSEGSYYLPAPGRGAAVAPGARFTYIWQLDAASGPRPDEPSSKAWLYHSHVNAEVETGLGLVGAIIVTDPKRARSDGMPRDVDREFATLFMIFDESGLGEEAIEAAEYAGLPGLASNAQMTWAELQQKLEQGSRYAINGRIFGNLPGLQMNEGERTRWYLFALGSEKDLHTAHWHGLRVLEESRRQTDVVELLPGSMKVADLLADNPGTWLFHCHVAEHMREGMFAAVTVHARDTVGVDRSPAAAFLGYPAATESMRLARVELRRKTAAPTAKLECVIQGVVTVFDGFAVFNEPVRVTLGDRAMEFRPDRQGQAVLPEATFRVKNANDAGVVRGGLMEFEIVVNDAPVGPRESVRLTLDVARSHHTATIIAQ